jgi:hypothetical protein
MAWACYRAKLKHLVLSVLDSVERNVPAFRVDGAIVSNEHNKLLTTPLSISWFLSPIHGNARYNDQDKTGVV